MGELRDVSHVQSLHTTNKNSFQGVIDAIEDYIQVITSRKSNALDDALEKLEGLERDLDGIITDIKECIEGRI